ncbi:MAG: hypothetical protein SGPRY_013282, partial [Prymnesium sp.]
LELASMPVVRVLDASSADVFSLIFPRKADGEWRWDEVRPLASSVAGFGLAPVLDCDFPWHDAGSFLLPLLGRETELNSAFEADIFQRVLRGVFTLVHFSKMSAALPEGHVWCSEGAFIEAVPSELAGSAVELEPGDEVLQARASGFSLPRWFSVSLTSAPQVPLIKFGWLHSGERNVVCAPSPLVRRESVG